MNKQYSIYDVSLKIDVENQFLYSNVKLKYHCSLSSTDLLKFYIYKDIEIDNIVCDKAMEYKVGKEVAEWSPFISESKLIKLTFNDPIHKGESINIHFRYKGHINVVTQYGINRLTRDWIELGLYTPWFPLSERLEQALFNVTINIDYGYNIINSKKLGDNLVINQFTPSVDCCIIASNRFKRIKGSLENIDINVYYTEDKYRGYAQQIRDYSIAILNKYKRFGKIDSQKLSIVIAPRENGGGYCRTGLIVLTPNDNLKNRIDSFKSIAHELAHLWWCKSKYPDTWEDWLNESFAEFSALLALREVFGEEEFNNKINLYIQKTKDLPPIKGLDRRDDKAYQVLYMKGPLILNELEKNIGKEKFEEFLNKIHTCNVDTTEKLLNKLYEITNQEVRESFNRLLLQ